MFTGIVAETGVVREVEESVDGRRLRIATGFAGLARGESVSVSGVCLTVEDHGARASGAEAPDRPTWFTVFLAAETVERTYLGDIAVNDRVNLERAMPAEGRFDGHLVQGHVDGTATIRDLREVGEDWRLRVSLPDDLARYLVEKGSIAVDGISLTVAALGPDWFEVAIVPETYERTTLSTASAGDPVHLEVDVVAKYVESLLAADRA